MSKKVNETENTKSEKKQVKVNSGDEVFAAIAMALHEMQDEVHDAESFVLTFSPIRQNYSPWSSKIYTLGAMPHKK